MFNVIHFDYNAPAAVGTKDFLEWSFRNISEVDYQDFGPVLDYTKEIKNLELLLPQKDLLLIHPGIKSQRAVYEYPSRFPHLDVALLIPEMIEKYDPENNVKLFCWGNIEEVVDYILKSVFSNLPEKN
jgi:hypothetical protein